MNESHAETFKRLMDDMEPDALDVLNMFRAKKHTELTTSENILLYARGAYQTEQKAMVEFLLGTIDQATKGKQWLRRASQILMEGIDAALEANPVMKDRAELMECKQRAIGIIGAAIKGLRLTYESLPGEDDVPLPTYGPEEENSNA